MILRMTFGGVVKAGLTILAGFFGVGATLLFQPEVFRGITLPLAARAVGWKARAVSASLSPLGKLQVEGLEAVNAEKSRLDLDSALVVVDLPSLMTGQPEILQADIKLGLIDLELKPNTETKTSFVFPFRIREADLEITEGRVRRGSGAWILGDVGAKAKGWDGKSPREIRGKIGKLSWNGPGKQELSGAVELQIAKQAGGMGVDEWTGKLAVDMGTVVDFSPLELLAPCRLVVEGKGSGFLGEDWKIETMHGSWQGVGGVQLSTLVTGQRSGSGDWKLDLQLDPVDLAVVGVLFQTRGVKSVSGNLGGEIHLEGGVKKPVSGSAKLQGHGVQIVSGVGLLWPAQPADLLGVTQGAWSPDRQTLRIEDVQLELGQRSGLKDLKASLDRPAEFHLQGGLPTSKETATLQWAFQGVELAAVVPLLVSPNLFKVRGGQLSAQGEGKIQGGTVQVTGRVESRAMKASGSWLKGDLQVDSAGVQFRTVFEGSKKFRLEEGVFQASWAGGEAEDLKAKIGAEWDWAKKEGWVMGDGQAGLVGLGNAWSGAKLWPDSGTAKLHIEFSGNLQEKGKGLASLTMEKMHWPGETAAAWKARASSELMYQAGCWSFPEFIGQAERGGQTLLESHGAGDWTPSRNEGKASLELTRVESSCLVPLLGLITPNWKWQAASGKGSFFYERKGSQDRVKTSLDGSITVETGTANHSRLVDFLSIQGGVQATWPSGTAGKLSVEQLSLMALHRDGSEAIRASLDQTLTLEKIGKGEWRPGGQGVAQGSIRYTSWPVGLFAPLIFPEAKETSLLGSASGSIQVRSDPKKRVFQGQVDLQMPDFTIDLPQVQLKDHEVSLNAGVTLGEKGDLDVPKVSLVLKRGGRAWLDVQVEKESRPALSAKGTLDLAVLKDVFTGWSDYLSEGNMTLEAEVGDPKDGARTIGYSAVINGFSGGASSLGTITGAEVRSQGILQWKNGLQSIKDAELSAKSDVGNLSVNQMNWVRDGAWAWGGGRFSEGWAAWLMNRWLTPARWVDGDVVAGAGFFQPGEYGGSGEVDLSLLDVRLMDDMKKESVSARLNGDFDYDKRTKSFVFKDGSLTFSTYPNDPVEIPSLMVGRHSVKAQVRGGVLDLRGILAQTEQIRNAKPAAGVAPTPEEPWRIDFSASLQQVLVEEATVGPVQIPRFRWGPEGILVDPSVVQVKGGLIQASVVQSGGVDQPVQAKVVMSKFPLGAILGNLITDANGPIGGWVDLQLAAQAGKPTLEELRRSLTGQGTFRLYQAHLERLPSLAKALRAAGAFLGSSFIAGSEINDLGSNFTLQGKRISVPNLKVSGTALSADLDGWLDWWDQTLDFKVRLALTKEAMQSSGQLQGVMTQLIGSSNDYYTKIPGNARITGTLADPKVSMDVGKMLAEGGINLLLNAPTGILQGAGSAAGGAAGAVTQPASSILQGVGNLFKGF